MWGVGMVVVVLVVMFSTQWFPSLLGWGLLLERVMMSMVMTDMFGALLGFEATSLLAAWV